MLGMLRRYVLAACAYATVSTALRISPCTSQPTQSWALTVGSKTTVRSESNGWCLSTLSCSPQKGDSLGFSVCGTSTCAGGVDQLFTLDALGRLTSEASQNTLTLTLANVVGPDVNLWSASGAQSNGEWSFNSTSAKLLTKSSAANFECLTSSGGPGSVIALDTSALGRKLYGVGGLAAIGGARLIYEYPIQQRSDILDLLFNETGGTAFQVLKTEQEGDMDSSYGSGSSYWHNADEEPDFTRGIYMPWLMQEAQARNPRIGTYSLAWGFPAWASNRTNSTPPADSALSEVALSYRIQYYKGIRSTYNLSFDLIGVHNERGWTRAFVKELRAALDANGFNASRISVGDGGNNDCEDCSSFADTSITTAAANDPEFAAALGVVGLHSAGETGLDPLPPIYDWESAGKDYIQSESNTIDGTFSTLNGAFPQWDPNAASTYGPGLSWPRQFILSYVNGRATGTIICPLSHAWTWTYGRHNHGTALFIRPWDGAYVLGAAFWTQAHFTQATRAGWHFLDGSASGVWDTGVDEGLTYASLVAPDFGDFSIIAVNVDPNATTTMDFQLVGALASFFSSTLLQAWTSNSTHLFIRGPDVRIGALGNFSYALPPRTALTLTTLRTLSKYEPAIPPRAPFPVPFKTAFSSQALNAPGRMLSDLFGATEIASDPLRERGRVLRQSVSTYPATWLGHESTPFTSLPTPGSAFANGNVTADVLIMSADAASPAFASVCGRVPIWQPANYYGLTPGACLRLNASGAWALVESTLTGGSSVLASGTLGSAATDRWHSLSLSFADDTASARIDGTEVAFIPAGKLRVSTGAYGVGTGWHRAYIDAVVLDAAAGHEPAPRSWLFDVLTGETLIANFSGWAGFVLDLRAPVVTPLTISALGRFRVRGNALPHDLDVIDAATGASVLPNGPVNVDFASCATDLLGFCYAQLPAAVTLPVGGRFYVVSQEAANGDAFISMTDAAAATTHAHRDGTTLMSYAGPGKGAVAGKVSKASSGEWNESGDVECSFGPVNMLMV